LKLPVRPRRSQHHFTVPAAPLDLARPGHQPKYRFRNSGPMQKPDEPRPGARLPVNLRIPTNRQSQRVQIGQQIVELLLRKHLAVRRHLAAPVLDDFRDPFVIGR
jgi:hypothetical protein